MDKLPTRLPWLHAQYPLHLLYLQLAELPHAIHPPHHMLDILRRNARERPKQLLSGGVHASASVRVLLCANGYGLGGVRLGVVQLQVREDVCCCEGRGGPDNAYTRERERKENELRLDIVGGDGCFCERALLLL